MRNIQKLIAFLLLLTFCSCLQDDTFTEGKKEENINLFAKGGNVGGGPSGGIPKNMPQYAPNKLIIQYKPGTPDAMKDGIRASHGIAIPGQISGTYEICRCNNQDIEEWTFVGTSIAIEPKKDVLEGEIDGEAFGLMDVDYEFIFGFDAASPIVGTDADTTYESYIKESNNGVTIAVLDTGVAPTLTVFSSSEKFLYDASETAIEYELSGWDFVDKDANTFDDDPFKHGSIIINQIHSALEAENIKHQILPIKIADKYGKISYFDMLCGTLYAAERAAVINSSFGWHGDPFGDFGNTIYENVLEMFPDVIVVASAGNTNNNNDETPHYPSSFDKINVISVGACNQGYGRASDFSNYGATSVDFFAKGESIPFYESYVKGTSFAAPQITIEVAKILENPTDTELSMVVQVAMLGFPVTESFIAGTNDEGESITKQTLHNRYISSSD